MAKGIDLSIAADTRSAMSAIQRGIIDPLEDVTDLLEKTGREGKDAGDDLEKGMRDAQRRTEDAKDEIRDLRDELNKAGRQGKKSGDDIGRGMRDSAGDMRKFGHASEEVSGELRQNLGETFSSFRGDVEDFGQIGQDVLGGLAGSVGSLAGSFALAAGAAGVGLLIAAIQTANEDQEKIKERAQEWANGYIEAGGRVLDFQTRMSGIQKVLVEQYDEAAKNAENWGVSIQTAAAAMSGSESAINQAQAGLDRISAAADQVAASGATVTDEFGNITAAGSELSGTVVVGQKTLDGYKQSLDIATRSSEAVTYAMIDQARATDGATEAVDEFGDTVISLPDGTQVYVDAETGQATRDVDQIQRKIYGVKGKTVGVGANTAAGNKNVDALQRNIAATTGKTVTVTAKARADLYAAQHAIDGFVRRNNGKEFKIYGRVVTPGGWD